ncbi:MAG: hypothetical protein AB7L09_21235 [Nitrospira sp.]
MITVRIVSWIHLCWGITMMTLNYVPRPFGSLEPFLQYLPIWELGIILTVTATLALTATHFPSLFLKRPWVVPLAAVPQQFALVWGVAWAANTIVLSLIYEHTMDVRTWYGASYQMVLAVFHAMGLYNMYKLAIIGTEVDNHAN